MQEVTVEELHKKADAHLNVLLRRRDEDDERGRRLEKNLEKMRQINQDEKGTKYFYKKISMDNKKEVIEALVEEEDSEDGGDWRERRKRRRRKKRRIRKKRRR
jgi:hypothetical protein